MRLFRIAAHDPHAIVEVSFGLREQLPLMIRISDRNVRLKRITKPVTSMIPAPRKPMPAATRARLSFWGKQALENDKPATITTSVLVRKPAIG